MHRTVLALVCLLLLPVQALAQDTRVEEIGSWAFMGANLAIDTVESFQCPNQTRCLTMQGVRLGATWGSVSLLKRLIRKERPCSPNCGLEDPHASFPSGHTATAFVSIGRDPQGHGYFGLTIPFGTMTGLLRKQSNKHDWIDVLAGAGIGLGLSFIR